MSAALLERLRAAGIACGRVSTLGDLARHPQLRLTEADTPGGRIRLLAPGAAADGETPTFGPVPALGADSARVRAEFGPGGEKAKGCPPRAPPQGHRRRQEPRRSGRLQRHARLFHQRPVQRDDHRAQGLAVDDELHVHVARPLAGTDRLGPGAGDRLQPARQGR
ncbi:hypothetical protein SAMN05444006_1077 [Allgaiera indica]|uniref:Uncharacterized protein n=1 Tax=Allgaiera indica TaxID=765699 RepID=A0A1H2WLQ4_9RHOB|nr:hypothetical protein SAMN05444006_1077 [Allgaiera indica]